MTPIIQLRDQPLTDACPPPDRCAACGAAAWHGHGTVARTVTDLHGDRTVSVPRYRCPSCGRHTVTVAPEGVDAQGRTRRLRAYLVLLYCLGLSHRGVEEALAPLGVHVDHVSVWRDLQELGAQMQARGPVGSVRVAMLDETWIPIGGEKRPVAVKKAIRHRTRGNSAERERLYSLLKRNRWTEDPFLHRQMRKQWRGGKSHVTNQIVADAGSYTTKVWHDRAWVYLQGLERGQRIAIPFKGTHLPSGTLRILLRDNGQVEVHYAVDETQVCSTRPCGEATVGVDKGYTEAYTDSDGERHGEDLGNLLSAESDRRKVKGQRRNRLRDIEQKHRAKGHHGKADTIRKNNLGNQKWDQRRTRHHKQVRDHLCHAAHTVVDKAGTIACGDLSAHMKSARYRHRDTNRHLSGWVKGVMADTLTSISRRRGSALAWVNPAYTSQVDSRTGLLQGTRRWDRFYCLDGVVLDADTNAACNMLARLYDEEIPLYMPYREVKDLLVERTRTAVGTAPPGLELRGRATPSPSTESESPESVPKCTR